MELSTYISSKYDYVIDKIKTQLIKPNRYFMFFSKSFLECTLRFILKILFSFQDVLKSHPHHTQQQSQEQSLNILLDCQLVGYQYHLTRLALWSSGYY